LQFKEWLPKKSKPGIAFDSMCVMAPVTPKAWQANDASRLVIHAPCR
jgi:hypothetical protein